MLKFYLFLWLSWLFRVVLCTLLSAALFAFIVTLFIYVKQGFMPIDRVVFEALLKIWTFWFSILLNLSLLFALFRSVKYLFNHCYAGYILKLKACTKKESGKYIEIIGYGDLLKVWRKWFMLLIWIVGSLMILAFVLTHLFTTYNSLFDWFSIYLLYLFIAIGGYFSFVFITARCKCIEVIKC